MIGNSCTAYMCLMFYNHWLVIWGGRMTEVFRQQVFVSSLLKTPVKIDRIIKGTCIEFYF